MLYNFKDKYARHKRTIIWSKNINQQQHNDESEEDPDWVSKSEMKRQVKALTQVGERLVQLPDTNLENLPLPANLSEAVHRAKKITKRGGLRRELLYIGKILRSIDASDIISALELIDQESAKDKESFHRYEQWRERLIADDEALKTFIDTYPQTNIQSLRQQLRLYHSAKSPAQKSKAFREIFQLVKSAITSSADD